MNWGLRSSWILERVTVVLSPMSLNLRPLKELLNNGAWQNGKRARSRCQIEVRIINWARTKQAALNILWHTTTYYMWVCNRRLQNKYLSGDLLIQNCGAAAMASDRAIILDKCFSERSVSVTTHGLFYTMNGVEHGSCLLRLCWMKLEHSPQITREACPCRIRSTAGREATSSKWCVWQKKTKKNTFFCAAVSKIMEIHEFPQRKNGTPVGAYLLPETTFSI